MIQNCNIGASNHDYNHTDVHKYPTIYRSTSMKVNVLLHKSEKHCFLMHKNLKTGFSTFFHYTAFSLCNRSLNLTFQQKSHHYSDLSYCSSVKELTGMRQRERKVETLLRSSSVALYGTTRIVG